MGIEQQEEPSYEAAGLCGLGTAAGDSWARNATNSSEAALDDARGLGNGDDDAPTRVATLIASVIMIVFFCVGVSSTFCVMFALVRHQRHQRNKNAIFLFVISLSANDFANLLTNQVLVIISYVMHGWHTGALLCEILPELNMLLVTCSMWHQALIAVHRYIVVVHSRWYQGINKTAYVVVVMVATRVVPLLFTVSLCATHGVDGVSHYVPKLMRCVYVQELRVRTFSMFFISFLLPCGVVVLCFTLIFAYVHRTGRRLVHSNSALKDEGLQIPKRTRSVRRMPSTVRFTNSVNQMAMADEKLLRRELQITKMFGVIFLVMVVGYVPYGTLRNYDSDGKLSPNAYVLVTALYAVASCMNGIIFMMNQAIRSITAAMFACGAKPASSYASDRPESAALNIQTPSRLRNSQSSAITR